MTAQDPDRPEDPAQPEDASEPTEAEIPQGSAADPPDEPEGAAGTEPEGAAGTEPEAAQEDIEREAEAPPPGKRERPRRKEEPEVVPGADLDPIAIVEEERELTAEERARIEAEEEERARREAELAREEAEEEAPRREVTVPADTFVQATGKRKSAVARVVIRAGEGAIEVNRRRLDEYFPRPHHQSIARQPLLTAGYDGSVDVRVLVHGGGTGGQAGAIRHGIARALCEIEPELRGDLKRRGMLTRDARHKERRKAGLKKARKRPQFSKR